ncbi:MAG: Asp-tRNA(Asn)/Glu-tRNA(Gln) amidotransferase GatCAB subunit A [Bacteroidetes bacterium]|nr:MAG: Asp-tRNA(Asn)/Glu-tRNA(Gln) amidotransferase GatCAB subunit A [Bacteroidota bacterium]
MYSFTTIQDFHQDINTGRITCEQVVRYFLQNIEQSKRLNAFVEVYAEEALQRAKDLDEKKQKGIPSGKLFGVVVGIKDVICFKDHKVTAASAILRNFVSLYSATAVEKLLDEDAIIIGSLNCDEFAMGSSSENSSYGNVLNAIDESRVPGGSSGGSAVAVQANCCMVSLGTDTGGSVRQPADFCGIVGLKPTYGRISRYGVLAYASSFDQIGIFSKNIPDAALVLEVVSGADDFDSTSSSKPVPEYSEIQNMPARPYKIAYFRETLEHPSLDPEIRSAIEGLIDKLQAEGHTVEPVKFEFLDYIVPAYYVLTTAEASSNLSRYDGVKYGYRASEAASDLTSLYKKTRSEGFGGEVKRRIMLGTFVLSAGYYDAYFNKAQQVRKLLIEKTNKIFADYEAIIMPTAPSVAFKLGEKNNDPIAMFLADIYTVFANLVGIPSLSVPIFYHKSGMPFGVQVMTNRFQELSLLHLSKSL